MHCYSIIANITVTTALEGNINLVGHSVMAQMIHSNRVNITGDTVKINALYSQSAKIVSAGSVSVGMLQGHSEVINFIVLSRFVLFHDIW